MDVDDLAILPAIKHLASKGHHRIIVSTKLVAGEGGRSQMPLALPKLAFAGEQAFPEHRRHMPPEELVLDVVSMFLDEHLLDRRQIADKKCRPPGKIERDEVAVPICHLCK